MLHIELLKMPWNTKKKKQKAKENAECKIGRRKGKKEKKYYNLCKTCCKTFPSSETE